MTIVVGFLYIQNMMNCPHCGHELKKNAIFCPHCGSDETTGFSDGARFSNEELPDYEEILENEFGDNRKSPYAKKKNPFNGVVGTFAIIIVVVSFIATIVIY